MELFIPLTRLIFGKTKNPQCRPDLRSLRCRRLPWFLIKARLSPLERRIMLLSVMIMTPGINIDIAVIIALNNKENGNVDADE